MPDDQIPNGLINDLKSGVTYDELETEYDVSDNQARRMFDDLREQGYSIDFREINDHGKRQFYIPDDVDEAYKFGNGDGEYRFALISDTHLGSKATHEEDLHDFYDRVQDEGIDVVFHCGDISDGIEVHQGQMNSLKGEAMEGKWQGMKDYVVDNYPEREGVDTFFIEGNHDHKLHRREGVRLGEMIDVERDDLHYLADSMATIVFDEENDVDLELIHPSGGKPYTEGYRAQTLFRERPLDQRPTIAGIGHLHGSMFTQTEGVNAFYSGAWKDLTTYGKRKGHAANIGGWLVDLELDDGEVRSLNPTWVNYDTFDNQADLSMQQIDEMLDGDGEQA